MRNTSKDFLRSCETGQRRNNEETVRKLESSIAKLTPSLADFKDPTIHPDVKRDQEFVESREDSFTNEPSYHAKGLEYLIQFGIAQGRLLNDTENDSYHTEPIWITRYDDLSNRIDAAAIVHTENEDYPYGIDLTTNPDKGVIRKKILLGSNDPAANYPVGFSQIKYCQSRSGQSSQPFIPRFCIGTSSDSIDDYLSRTRIDRMGNVISDKHSDAFISFKVLYEMRKQSELFLLPLYEKIDAEKCTPEEEQAAEKIDELANIYEKELSRISGLLPPYATKGCEKRGKNGNIIYRDDKVVYDIDKIAEYLMHDEDIGDPTFAAIIETTETIAKEYESGNDYDYLEKARDLYRKQGGSYARRAANSAKAKSSSESQ